MVSGVDIDTVPARWHVDARIEPCFAISGREAIPIVASVARIAKAGPLYGALAKLTLRSFEVRILLGASTWITAQHFEPRGKSFETRASVFLVAVTAVLVVNQETSVADRLEKLSLGILKI